MLTASADPPFILKIVPLHMHCQALYLGHPGNRTFGYGDVDAPSWAGMTVGFLSPVQRGSTGSTRT